MKAFVLLVVLLLCIACNVPVDYPTTINIDSNMFKALAIKFLARELWKAPDYLGGLEPAYPIALADIDCLISRDTNWMSGGFICSTPKILIKKQNDYTLISNRAELKKTYAPITSEQEALSYAILYTRFFAIFDIAFFKSSYTYFGETPSISYVKFENGSYLVHLFSYQQFGCSHPYYSALVKVYKSGDVEILKKEVSFEDPKQSNLCVD